MQKDEHSTDRIGKLIQKAKTTTSKKTTAHSYKYEKPLVSKLKNFNIKGAPHSNKSRKSKATFQIPIEQKHCTPNQKYPLFFLEKTDPLSLKKIKSLQAKEQLIALRNLKMLSHTMQQWIHSYFHQDVKVFGKQKIQSFEFLDKREERHFQIDRIIRYLSEP